MLSPWYFKSELEWNKIGMDGHMFIVKGNWRLDKVGIESLHSVEVISLVAATNWSGKALMQ